MNQRCTEDHAQKPALFNGQITVANLLTIGGLAGMILVSAARGDTRLEMLEHQTKAQEARLEQIRKDQQSGAQLQRDELRAEIRDVNAKLDHVLEIMMKVKGR